MVYHDHWYDIGAYPECEMLMFHVSNSQLLAAKFCTWVWYDQVDAYLDSTCES